MENLIPNLVAFNLFKMGLGMQRCRRVDDIWDDQAFQYHPNLSRLLKRPRYYKLLKHANVDVCILVKWCSAVWSDCWIPGEAMAGDEMLVPFKGHSAGPIRQYIPRKPHNTGIKLYALVDSMNIFCIDLYLYTSTAVIEHPTSHSGALGPRGIVQHWHAHLPPKVVLLCDSFFGTHASAEFCSVFRRPFVFLVKRDAQCVSDTPPTLPSGHMVSCTFVEYKYSLHVYKNPAVGSKAPRLVPLLSNCEFDPTWPVHKRGYTVPPPIGFYRKHANGVDTMDQLALQHREVGRHTTWSRAVRSFVLRVAIVNTFTVCKELGLTSSATTLYEFQQHLLQIFAPEIFGVPNAPSLHCPKTDSRRRRCKACNKGKTHIYCVGCRKHLHLACFARYHNC